MSLYVEGSLKTFCERQSDLVLKSSGSVLLQAFTMDLISGVHDKTGQDKAYSSV